MTQDTVTKIATPAVGSALSYSSDAEVELCGEECTEPSSDAGQAHRSSEMLD